MYKKIRGTWQQILENVGLRSGKRIPERILRALSLAIQTFKTELKPRPPSPFINPKLGDGGRVGLPSPESPLSEKTIHSVIDLDGLEPVSIQSVSNSTSVPIFDSRFLALEKTKQLGIESELLKVEGFWAYVDSFLKTQNSKHTQRAYEKDLVDFLSFLKMTGKPMNVHTMVSYRDLLQNRKSDRTQEPLSHVSINRKMATIKSFLNWLVLNSVLPNNPARAVKSFRAGRESPTRDIPDDMVQRILAMPYRHSLAGRAHYAILMILFHLGLRRTELVDLRTSDLFEQEGMRVLRVRGKGDKERILPLPKEVSKSLEIYFAMAKKDSNVDQPLFSPVKNNVTKEMNKHLHPNAVAYIVKHYSKLAGVNYRVSPHSARATAVSNALDNHAPHRSVQHMAGWSSPLMVSRYDKRKQDLRNSGVHFIRYSEKDEVSS